MSEIPETHLHLLTDPNVVTFATIGPSGTPQLSAIWVTIDEGQVRTSLWPGRQKYRNLLADPRASLLAIDPADARRTLEIRGTVEMVEDTGLAFLQRLLPQYGTDLERFTGATDGRVVVTLVPTRIRTTG